MRSFSTVHAVESNRVSAAGGALWSEVLAATLPLGLTPPVLTDYLELSVGGTLSVGGLGGASHRHGAQTDNVIELEAVTTTGEVKICSSRQNKALFDALRAGNGRSGLIISATLALIPAPTKVRRYKLPCADPETLITNQLRLVNAGTFDYLEGQVLPHQNGADWRYVLECASYFTPAEQPRDQDLLAGLNWSRGTEEIEDLSYADFLNRMAPSVELLRSAGAWDHPHPWCNILISSDHIRTILGGTMRMTRHEDLGGTGLGLVYPIPTNRFTTPGFPKPKGAVAFLFALLRTALPDDPSTLERMLRANRLITGRVLELGGSVYLR
jgi:hypothetical protein